MDTRIPLLAGQGVTPIQGPLDLAKGIQAYQAGNLALQGERQKIQQTEQDKQDSEVAKKIYLQANGDWDQASEIAKQNGLMTHAVKFQELGAKQKKEAADYQSSLAKMSKEQREMVMTRLEDQSKFGEWVQTLPPEAQPKAWSQGLAEIGEDDIPYDPATVKAWASKRSMFLKPMDPNTEFNQKMELRKQEEVERNNRFNNNKPSGSAGSGKAPSGYRYTPEGDLEPIKGGPADIKGALAEEKKASLLDSVSTTIDTAQRLLDHPGLPGAVGTWNYTKNIPGTESANFAAELDALKAQTFIPQVQALKGMGQLSDAEGKKLTDSIGALSYNMTEKAFKESLGRIIAGLERGKSRLQGVKTVAPQVPNVAAPTSPISLEDYLKSKGQ